MSARCRTSTRSRWHGHTCRDPRCSVDGGGPGAFLAGYSSPETPFRTIRRTHIELYLRDLEASHPRPAATTIYRRIATLSAWFRWLEDEHVNVGNPAARVRRPLRHPRPQPWLNRNQLTDLLAAAEDEGGHAYAAVCLLGLNGLRISEACSADVDDLVGSRLPPRQREASPTSSMLSSEANSSPSSDAIEPSPTSNRSVADVEPQSRRHCGSTRSTRTGPTNSTRSGGCSPWRHDPESAPARHHVPGGRRTAP